MFQVWLFGAKYSSSFVLFCNFSFYQRIWPCIFIVIVDVFILLLFCFMLSIVGASFSYDFCLSSYILKRFKFLLVVASYTHMCLIIKTKTKTPKTKNSKLLTPASILLPSMQDKRYRILLLSLSFHLWF